MDTQDGIDWTLAAHLYPMLEEAPSFISQQRQAAGQHVFTTSANRANLQGKQQQVYTIVQQHQSANSPPPLRMIVSGTAGTGKSYLINCLRLLLQLQLVWPPSKSMARPSIPSSACPPEQSSRTWRERDSPSCSRPSQRSSISSLTRCQWWGGRSSARLTDVSARPSLTTPRRCLEDAPAFSSEISARFLLSWTCPSTPPTLALSSLTRGEQPTRPSSRQWCWTRSCGRLARTLSR